jgi:hypothetical protein
MNRLYILFAALLFALPATAKPKHVIADYDHTGVLFYQTTGMDLHGPHIYHIGGYTCLTHDDPEYGPECDKDTTLLIFYTEDGKEHMASPANFNFRHDVLNDISLQHKYQNALFDAGVKFVYRTDGKFIYVPYGKIDKQNNFHISGEKSYLL